MRGPVQGENGQFLRLKEEQMELKKKLADMKQPAALPDHLGLRAAHLGGVLLRSVPRTIRGRYLLKVTIGANSFYFTTSFYLMV